jgi:hypothetical protein
MNVNNTVAGSNAQCPLGVQDYNFGPPVDGGNVFPGPCGV